MFITTFKFFVWIPVLKSHTQTKEMKTCQRCGTSDNLTDHHVLPLAHFGSKRTNRHTITLCEKHHQILENGILFLEARLGGAKFGTRVKLKAQEYEAIANLFVKKRFCN